MRITTATCAPSRPGKCGTIPAAGACTTISTTTAAPFPTKWVDSTPLAQTWEAMTQAWDYGIRELWIVNVGDLKLHEVPLTYFMALACDFDK